MVSPSVPRLRSRYAIFGCATALRTSCRSQDDGRPIEPSDASAVQLVQELGKVGGHEIDQGRRRGQCFLFGERAALCDGLRSQRCVAMPVGGERARIGGDILGRFLRHRLVDLLAAALDRMCGPDVGPRRHGGDIGGDGDQESGGRGASARWTDEHDDRRPGGDHVRHDRPGGIDETAWSPQREDDQRRTLAIRTIHRLVHVIRGDRMNNAVDLGGVHDGSVWDRRLVRVSRAHRREQDPKAQGRLCREPPAEASRHEDRLNRL
jgi:hypothetical protein